MSEESVRYHPQAGEVGLFETAYRRGLPLLLKGPTGCGKTRFVRHMAQRLDLPLHTVACHDDLSANDLLGRYLIEGEETVWRDGPLTRAVRESGICYLDEVVEARKDVTVLLHPLTDDRRQLPIDKTGEVLDAPDDFMLVVSYNPGYQHLFKSLKPSTRQRFLAASFDFPDADTEARILQEEAGLPPGRAAYLVELGRRLRGLESEELEEVASTRLLVYAASLMSEGMEPLSACRAALVEPLTDDPEVAEGMEELVRALFEV